MTEIRVVSKDHQKSGWSFGQVIGRDGDSLMIRDLDHSTEDESALKRARIHEVREVKKIPLCSLVVPHVRGTLTDWSIGHVIGMSSLDLSIGPLLHIRDIITGKLVKALPYQVDQLIRDPRTQFA